MLHRSASSSDDHRGGEAALDGAASAAPCPRCRVWGGGRAGERPSPLLGGARLVSQSGGETTGGWARACATPVAPVGPVFLVSQSCFGKVRLSYLSIGRSTKVDTKAK